MVALRRARARRDFFQRIDQQYLAKELKDIAKSGRDGELPDATLFDPKIRLRPMRRLSMAAAEAEATRAFSDDQADFPKSPKTKPWLHYESLRGQTYPSGGFGPRYRDLTHAEAQRLQEMYMRKKMMDRKILWLKQSQLPNPQKDAKMTLRRLRKQEEQEKAAGDGGDMYPLPFEDIHPGSPKLQRMEEQARLVELESRFRARIRQQKVENARIVKANQPKVGELVLDPIQRHVHRRLVRQREKIHAGLEGFLSHNSAQLLYEHLGGAAVSIVRIRAKRPRCTQEIQYNLTSDHDPDWVQRQLNIAAPKLRSQFALKVNMGQTPNIKFVPYSESQEVKRRYLWRFAKAIKDGIPAGGFGTKLPATEAISRLRSAVTSRR
ncbi:unnamed protein product [Durusdinium trenchii]|uniref:Uncharacterized protein n=1 Tax=Durusdinium trenchii TaxID=1381693 RepID=A0ABP0IUH8_9DINO